MRRFMDRFGGIVTAVCEMAAGVMLLIDHVWFSEKSIMVLGIVLAAMGIFEILGYFRMTPEVGAQSMTMTRGLLGLLVGFFFVFEAKWFTDTVEVLLTVYSAIMMVLGVRKLAATVDMIRLKNGAWPWKLLSGAVSLSCAFVALGRPFSEGGMWIFLGVVLVVQAGVDAAALVMAARLRNRAAAEAEAGEEEESTDLIVQ